jgi:hypothetical protein
MQQEKPTCQVYTFINQGTIFHHLTVESNDKIIIEKWKGAEGVY